MVLGGAIRLVEAGIVNEHVLQEKSPLVLPVIIGCVTEV